MQYLLCIRYCSELSHCYLIYSFKVLKAWEVFRFWRHSPAFRPLVPWFRWISLRINFCDNHSPSNSVQNYYQAVAQIRGPHRVKAPGKWCFFVFLLCWPIFIQDSRRKLRLRENKGLTSAPTASEWQSLSSDLGQPGFLARFLWLCCYVLRDVLFLYLLRHVIFSPVS